MRFTRDDNRRRLTTGGLCVVIAAAVVLSYANSLYGPFIFDDVHSIPDNEHVRRLWPLTEAMTAPSQSTVAGRPVVCLSLAINYAINGLDVRGYHLFNITVHLLSAFLLFGVIRRMLQLPVFAGRYERSGPYLAAAAAALWAVHPLQTEAVTYIIQRTELLFALFYLLTLYSAILGWQSEHPRVWFTVAILACAAGMGTKEVMVSAPVMVLLYERTLVAGSFRGALGRHAFLYAGLAATWGLLAWINIPSPRSASVGFHFPITWWEYLLTQSGIILWYLRLSFWPHPLVISYEGWPIAHGVGDILPQGMVILALLALTGWALWRRRAIGFAGAWFFLVLAPTSSVVPIVTEIAAERRMYLPLAAIVIPLVIGGYRLLLYLAAKMSWSPKYASCFAAVLAATLVAASGAAGSIRNRDYRSAVAIWTDAVHKRPDNYVAQCNLGMVLNDVSSGRRYPDKAMEHYKEAIRLQPEFAEAHNNLGFVLIEQGRIEEAVKCFTEAVRLRPDLTEACLNLGMARMKQQRFQEAAELFARLVQLHPRHAEAHACLGRALLRQWRFEESVGPLTESLQLRPDDALTHANLASALIELKQFDEAADHIRQAIRLNPGSSEVYNELGTILAREGHFDEAARQFEAALGLQPNDANIEDNLGTVFFYMGQIDKAIEHYGRALQLRPDYSKAYYHLGNVHLATGRTDDAIMSYKEALRLEPLYGEARYRLGQALARAGKFNEAVEHFRELVRDRPDYAPVHLELARGLAVLGQYQEAASAYRQVLQLDPGNAEARAELDALPAGTPASRSPARAPGTPYYSEQ